MMQGTPEELACQFLSNYVDAPREELQMLDITQGLTALLQGVVAETVRVMNDEQSPEVLH